MGLPVVTQSWLTVCVSISYMRVRLTPFKETSFVHRLSSSDMCSPLCVHITRETGQRGLYNISVKLGFEQDYDALRYVSRTRNLGVP